MGADLARAGAVSVAGAPVILDVDLAEVFLDQALLDRVVRSIQLDRGGSYLDAMAALQAGADGSLRGALEQAGLDLDYVAAALQILEALDAAAENAHERTSRRLARERVDGLGRVRLEVQATALVGSEPRERRLARARRAAPGQFEGDAGQTRFFALDRQHIAVGLDVVRTLERPAEIRTVRCNPAAIAAQMVQSVAAAADKRHRLRVLEAKVQELRGAVVDIDDARTDAARRRRGRSAPPAPARRRPAEPTPAGRNRSGSRAA